MHVVIVLILVAGPAINKAIAPPGELNKLSEATNKASGIEAVAQTYNGIDKIKIVINSKIPLGIYELNKSPGGL
mgnify:CR=1 FL=1